MLHGMAFLWLLTPGLAAPAVGNIPRHTGGVSSRAQHLAALGIVFAAFVKGVTGMGFPVRR